MKLNKKLIAPLCGAAAGALAVSIFRSPVHGGRPDVQGLLGRHLPWLMFDKQLDGHWPLFYACAGAWVLFGLYWDAAAKNAAPALNLESRLSRAVHVSLVSLAQLLILIPITGLGRYLPVSTLIMAAG